LFDEVKLHINLIGGTLSGRQSLLNLTVTRIGINRVLLVTPSAYQSINLITLYHTDPEGKSVSYRIYNKQEGKNDYLREMIEEILGWGIQPKIVTGDAWYSSRENLKFLKKQELGFCLDKK